jgi:hypothetical protein
VITTWKDISIRGKHLINLWHVLTTFSGRFEVPQVSYVGCGCKSRNSIELEAEHSCPSTPVSGNHIAAASCSKQAVTPSSLTGKLTKSVSGIFSRYLVHPENFLVLNAI